MAKSTLEYNTDYIICLAEIHHIPELNSIELAAATIFPHGLIPEHVLTDRVPQNVLLSAQQKKMLWVAVDVSDFPVGYLLIQMVDGLPLLAQLDVHPLHGRKGLGTALIAHGIMHVQEMGFTDLYLTTFSHIRWNAPFYKRLGFKTVNEQELPKSIAGILHEERLRGLSNRVAMRLSNLSDNTAFEINSCRSQLS